MVIHVEKTFEILLWVKKLVIMTEFLNLVPNMCDGTTKYMIYIIGWLGLKQ